MLEHFFGSKTRVKLLQIFFKSPERAFFVRELARIAETQLNAIRREISHLETIGLIATIPLEEVKNRTSGTERSKYYKLQTTSLLYPELKGLLAKAQLLEEQALIELLKNKAGDLKLLLLTGTFTGERDAQTDILLVGSVKPMIVSKLIKAYEESGGNELRYTVMEHKEFKERRELGDKFLYGIFEAKHLLVVNEYNLS